jgi:micrococcal nuclease
MLNKIVMWIIGLFLALLTLSALLTWSIPAGILMGIAAFLALPPTYKTIRQRKELGATVRASAIVGLFIVSTLLLPYDGEGANQQAFIDPQKEQQEKEEQKMSESSKENKQKDEDSKKESSGSTETNDSSKEQTNTQRENSQTEQNNPQQKETSNNTSSEQQQDDSQQSSNETKEKEQSSSDNARVATVTKVTDGDTFDVRFQNGSTETVRMLGVDTPEVYKDNKPNEYGDITDVACLNTWGNKASDYVRNRIKGQQVELIFDAQAGRRGGFDRLLAYTKIDGNLLGSLLLNNGYAKVYTGETFAKEQAFLSLQNKAKSKEIGLWSCGQAKRQQPQEEQQSTQKEEGSSNKKEESSGTDYSQYTCNTNKYNCSDFDSGETAQGVFEKCGGADNDVHRLDNDGNGEACESL